VIFENQEIVPPEAVASKVTVPVFILDPGVVPVMVGVVLTVTFAVLFALIIEEQLPFSRFVRVIVVEPAVVKALVVKLPVPAVVTFIVAVFPVARFGADKS
jgi:hypothetical protein